MNLQIFPLLSAKQSQLATGLQPKGNKIPPLGPEFQQTAVFFAKEASTVPCALLSKLNAPLQLRAETQEPVEVPKHVRFLRGAFDPDIKKGVDGQSEPKKRRRKSAGDASNGDTLDEVWTYKAIFGLPWACEQFIKRACKAGHPAKSNRAVPKDLQVVLDKHMEWSEQTLVAYRMDWCRRWLKRAVELEVDEKKDLAKRPLT